MPLPLCNGESLAYTLALSQCVRAAYLNILTDMRELPQLLDSRLEQQECVMIREGLSSRMKPHAAAELLADI